MSTLIDPFAASSPDPEHRRRAEVASIESTLIGVSPDIREVREMIAKLASSSLPVLIEGPTGTGKEMVARCLHIVSRRPGSIVCVNASAIPETMFETLVFGHARGAFTGAEKEHLGFMDQARGGTLFLDELGTLAISMQPKLLRAMEDGSYRPVGAVRDRFSDCRIIAATNEPVALLCATGRLRRDLAYRIAKVVIRISPLCDRPEDIPLLVRHFVRSMALPAREFTRKAMDRLMGFDWPGNARELKSVVEAAMTLAEGPEITELDVGSVLASSAPSAARPTEDLSQLISVLEACDWSVASAATELGIHFSTLYRRLHRLGIKRQRKGRGA